MGNSAANTQNNGSRIIRSADWVLLRSGQADLRRRGFIRKRDLILILEMAREGKS